MVTRLKDAKIKIVLETDEAKQELSRLDAEKEKVEKARAQEAREGKKRQQETERTKRAARARRPAPAAGRGVGTALRAGGVVAGLVGAAYAIEQLTTMILPAVLEGVKAALKAEEDEGLIGGIVNKVVDPLIYNLTNQVAALASQVRTILPAASKTFEAAKAEAALGGMPDLGGLYGMYYQIEEANIALEKFRNRKFAEKYAATAGEMIREALMRGMNPQ